MSGGDDQDFELPYYDREEWLDDLKNCPALQLKSPTGDFNWSIWERGRQYSEYRKARREERARKAAVVQKAKARDAAIDEAEHSEARNGSTGFVLASTRPRTLFIRARVHSGHTCEREHAERHDSGVAPDRPVAPATNRLAPPSAPAPPSAHAPARNQPAPQPDEIKPHDLLLIFLDAIGVDSTNPRLVQQVIVDRHLRSSIANETNYAARRFFKMLRSHNARFWGVNELRAAGDKILGELRKRHLGVTTVSRLTGLSRPTIRSVGRSRHMRMSTLIAIGTPAGFLDGRFSVPSAR